MILIVASGKRSTGAWNIPRFSVLFVAIVFFGTKKVLSRLVLLGVFVQHDPTVFLLGCQTGPFLVRHKRKIIPPPF